MKDKTRVAVVLHGLGANGIDTLFYNLSSVWDYTNFEITYFIAVDQNNKQVWEDRVAENGCRVIKLHDLDKGRLIYWPITLYKALKKYGPFDAIHVNMDMLNGLNLVAARIANVQNRICHSHISASQRIVGNGKSILSAIYYKVMKFLIQMNSTARIGCSEEAMRYLYGGKWNKCSNSYVVNNGILLEKYTERNSREEKLNELGLSSNENYILTVGRISAVKNPDFILNIMLEFRKRGKAYKLLWCGSGDLEDVVKNKIIENNLQDTVILLGNRNDIPQIIRCASVFILPSKFEGLGVVLIEAQAAGVATIASNMVPNQVDCGLCQFLSICEGVSIWCDAIEQKLSSNSLNCPDMEKLSRYDIRNMKEKLQSLYTNGII